MNDLIMNKKKLVVLTGAGISAESGIRTFRDGNGLWEDYNIEDVATPHAWKRDPGLVLRFYNQRRKDVLKAVPNSAHFGIAALEQLFQVTVITQNIDDLHERAGSTNVLHLHGEILKMRCETDDRKLYDIREDIHLGDHSENGYQLRPHVVWFEEPVPMIGKAIPEMKSADLFILVGSSLAVYPAAGLLAYLPDDIPKFIVDKSIPPVHSYSNIIPIEKPATEGIAAIRNLLEKGQY